MAGLLELDKENQERLLNVFPNIVDVTSGVDGHGYKMLSVSVFDHWLTEEEAMGLLQNVSNTLDAQRKSLHYCLNKKIVTSVNAVSFDIHDVEARVLPIFMGFSGPDTACEYVVPSNYDISTEFYFRLAMPDLRCLYFEGSDYTNHLYFQQEADVVNILKFAAQCGLSVLR